MLIKNIISIFLPENLNYFCFTVPLGSISELPAESCKEIKLSEGEQAVSGKYWFYFPRTEKAKLAHCDMTTEGNL